MKKHICIIIALAVIPLSGMAQAMDFNDLFRKYTGNEGYTTMEFTGALLKMLTGSESGDDSFLGVTSFKMISSTAAGSSFVQEARAVTSHESYDMLVNISTGSDGFRIYHKPKGKGKNRGASEFILLSIDNEDVTIIYVEGDIDMKNIMKLKDINVANK